MTNSSSLAFLLLFQSGSPSYQNDYSIFNAPIILAFIVGFVLGVALTAILFLAITRNTSKASFGGGNLNSSEPETVLSGVAIKLCPGCNSTYTDEALSYCLRTACC